MSRILGITITKKKIKGAISLIVKGRTKVLKIREGEIKGNSDRELIREIRNFIKKERLKAKEVSFGIPEEDVIIKIGTYPKMPDADLKKIILDEISSYKSFKDDYPVLNIFKLVEEENKDRILVVSIPRKRAVMWIDIIRKAGLNLKRIELNPLASFRAIKVLKKELVLGSGLFIFLNLYKTTLLFFNKGNIVFLREFEIGIEDIRESKSLWINEVLNTISFYTREEKTGIERIILSGIDDGVEDVLNELKERTDIPVEIGTPIKDAHYTLFTSIGLSLFKIEDKLKINLIPKDIIERPKDEMKVFFSSLFIVLIALVILSLSSYLITSQKVTNIAINDTKKNLERLNSSLEEFKNIEVEYAKIKKELENFKNITGEFKKSKTEDYISKIYKLKGNVVIVNMGITKNKGISLSFASTDFNSIFSYRKRLINEDIFEKVDIVRMEKKKDGGVVGEMMILIREEKGD